MPIVSRFIVAAFSLFAASSAAAQCAQFSDVPPSNIFCDNIQWIKNRGVTQGCVAGQYCPLGNATREQMAAFMNRLGRALTPEILQAQADTGPIVLPGEPPAAAQLQCITADTTLQVAPVQYARQASVTAQLSGLGDGAGASWKVAVLVSTDGGTTWNNMNGVNSVGMRETSNANQWASSGVTEHMSLDPGTSYRFAVGVRRDNIIASAGNLAAGRCQIAATVVNRNPSTPPF